MNYVVRRTRQHKRKKIIAQPCYCAQIPEAAYSEDLPLKYWQNKHRIPT